MIASHATRIEKKRCHTIKTYLFVWVHYQSISSNVCVWLSVRSVRNIGAIESEFPDTFLIWLL